MSSKSDRIAAATAPRTKIIEVYTQSELRRQIEEEGFKLAHAAAREQKMANLRAIPVGRGPVEAHVERIALLRRRLDLRIEQDAGREDIAVRATGFAREIDLASGPLRTGLSSPALQKAVWAKLQEIATRVQAQTDFHSALQDEAHAEELAGTPFIGRVA